LLIGTVTLCVEIGKKVQDSSFWWKMMLWLFVQFAMWLMCQLLLWPAVPDWGDLEKTLFVMVFAPIITEMGLTVCRFISRGIPEHHEAANWVLNGYILAAKNIHVRLIICLIQNPYVAAFASFVNLPNNFYNEERDRFLYRSSRRLSEARHTIEYGFNGKRFDSRSESAQNAADDPTLKPRNKTLRLRLHHVETTIEIICTIVAVFMVLMFGVSVNGRDPPGRSPALEQLLLNAAIQLVAECVQCLLCSLFQVVVERQPALSVPLLRIRGFTLVLALMTASSWCDAIGAVLPVCIGRRADSNTDWVFITAEFRHNDLNATAICAAFPEAVGFAQRMC